jgi:hypothetical protein
VGDGAVKQEDDMGCKWFKATGTLPDGWYWHCTEVHQPVIVRIERGRVFIGLQDVGPQYTDGEFCGPIPDPPVGEGVLWGDPAAPLGDYPGAVK